MMQAKSFFIRWLPVLIWASLIFYLSAQPDLRISQDALLDKILRKAAHMFVFGVLWLLLLRAFNWRNIWLAFGLTIAYAASDEYHQHFVYGRHADIKDVGIDTIGSGIAYTVWKILHKHLNKQNN